MFYFALILLFLAFCVVVIEFFIPSAGVLGILAGCLAIAALWFGFNDSMVSGAIILMLAVVAIPILFIGWIKIWPHTWLGRQILQGEAELSAENILPNSGHYQKTASLEGQIGVAKTKMLPSGQVVINGEKFDAVSEGFAIEPGVAVIVSSVRGNRIYVEPYEGETAIDAEGLPARDREILEQPIDELGLDSIDDLLSE
ncbi:MAG: NfeD family protein [Planctomycetota bacterium]